MWLGYGFVLLQARYVTALHRVKDEQSRKLKPHQKKTKKTDITAVERELSYIYWTIWTIFKHQLHLIFLLFLYFWHYRTVAWRLPVKNGTDWGDVTWRSEPRLKQRWRKDGARNYFTSTSTFCIYHVLVSVAYLLSSFCLFLYLPLTSLLPFLLPPNYFTCTPRPPASPSIICQNVCTAASTCRFMQQNCVILCTYLSVFPNQIQLLNLHNEIQKSMLGSKNIWLLLAVAGDTRNWIMLSHFDWAQQFMKEVRFIL